MSTVHTIDTYIASFPTETQAILTSLRALIKEEIPDAEETISYGVPTYKKNGTYVVYFAGFKKHISMYPVFLEMEKTLPDITQYRTGKGTLQFPLSKPLPMPLIRKIVKELIKWHAKRIGRKK